MKKYLFAFLLLFFSCSGFSTEPGADPSGFPELKEIVTVFAQNFELDDYRNKDFYRFNFIRNPSGWYVQPEYFSGSGNSPILIWSEKDKYPSHITPEKKSKDVLLTELISNRDLYNFSIHPFYGYKGWTDDVIRFYESRSMVELSDNELYGSGRAYAQKASDIFWSHSLYSDPSEATGIEAGKRDAKLYLANAEKSIECFQSLYRRSPGYITLIGLMDIKYANEVMNSFYELLIFGFEKESEKLLKRIESLQLYEPFWQNYASEILAPLKENAILFTNGDNDTYPLIWAQNVKQYRTDVMVINLSLLNDPYYYYLITKNAGTKPVNRNKLSRNQLLSLSRKTILIDDEEPCNLSFVNVETMLAGGLEKNNPLITLPYGNYIMDYITDEGIIDTLTISSGIRGNVQSPAEYLLRSIINDNAGERQLCFSKGMQPRFKSMIDRDHLVDKGLYYSVEKKNNHTISFDNVFIDTTSMLEMISSTKLSLPGPKYFARTIIHNIILEAKFIQIYNAEIRGEYARKYDLMVDFLINYPPDKTGINYYYLFIVDNLYKSGRYEDFSIRSFKLYTEVLEQNILSTTLSDDNPRDIQELRYYLSILTLVKMSSFAETDEDLEKNISSLEATIGDRLLEFPEISFR